MSKKITTILIVLMFLFYMARNFFTATDFEIITTGLLLGITLIITNKEL